jgi:glycosyltransferase involved in cell wall biosynthesis
MRILSVTAGAASMYCGSCLRDNALAAQLITRGHDVTLIPLYTPLLSDEANVTRPEVLFGGISIYLQHQWALFRRLPRFVDRLLDAPWLIRAFADRSVSTDPKLLGGLTISMLDGPGGVLRKEFDKLLEWVRQEPRPDVVTITNSMLIGLARPLADALRAPICCTLQGEALFLEGLTEPYRTRAIERIRAQVRDVDRFVAVSGFEATYMRDYLGIPAEKMAVVPLGIRVEDFKDAKGAEDAEAPSAKAFTIGFLGRIAPEKGLHLLADAFVRLRRKTGRSQMRLEAAGYLAAAHKPYLADVQRILERAGLQGDFVYHGAVDRAGKTRFLRGIDVMSMPATYDEPKGFTLLEAMASGVPVVEPRRGALTEIVERAGGGLLVPPDNPELLADGLCRLWTDRSLREELGRRGREGVRQHYTIEGSTQIYEDVISQIATRDSGLEARGSKGTAESRVPRPEPRF